MDKHLVVQKDLQLVKLTAARKVDLTAGMTVGLTEYLMVAM